MKNIRLNILLITLFLILVYSSSYSNSKFNFIIGLNNKYIYHYTLIASYPPYYVNTIIVASFTKDTIILGRKYYRAVNFPFANNGWVRWDSVTGCIFKYDSANSCSFYNYEILVDSLFTKLGDCLRNCPSPVCVACIDTSYLNIFSYLRKRKSFRFAAGHGGTTTSFTKTLVDTIGYYGHNFTAYGGSSTNESYILNGCIIGGKVYGDTSIPVGIHQITETPFQYSLSQNYPNPFNPVTRIKFSLPNPSKGGTWKNVSLVIYDVLGREVETLIPPPGGGQEGLKPGSYEVTWDGSRYASGVYFYRLMTDDPSTSSGQGYVETKKMVLIK
jgi:hypothetical protein